MRTLLLLLATFILSCQSIDQTSPSKQEDQSKHELKDDDRSTTETEIVAAVERFLFNAGNYDTLKMRDCFWQNANIGTNWIKDGKWESGTMTFDGYLELVKDRPLRPYYEPVHQYTIHISKDQLAFVKAEATLYRFGVPRSANDDFFTLMRTADGWRIVNGSYTAKRLPEADQIFDLEAFARGYSQAWSGVRPEFVAMFFEEDGSLRVNDGDAAIGRDAITGVARSFMTDLPDMAVRFDSLVAKGSITEFHWTLTGTNSGPGGTGNKVRVSGYEEWTLGENGLVQRSQGHFPSDIYQKQLQEGIGE